MFEPERENAAVHVKRVAAVPGDTVEIRDGSVYVNGKLYGEEGMIDMNAEGLVREMITLEKDEYFVLGDNSGESEDSRYQDIGSIEKKMIIGKVWFVVSPLKSFGFK
jgi:signal peptidase I